jgi:hypothetical protein
MVKRYHDESGSGPKGFARVPVAAEYAGLTVNAYRAGMARGEFPFTRVGGRILGNLEELHEFLRSSPGVSAKAALENHARRASR